MVTAQPINALPITAHARENLLFDGPPVIEDHTGSGEQISSMYHPRLKRTLKDHLPYPTYIPLGFLALRLPPPFRQPPVRRR